MQGMVPFFINHQKFKILKKMYEILMEIKLARMDLRVKKKSRLPLISSLSPFRNIWQAISKFT
jgi:ABC-type uncharacterized transport system permease subunit